VQWWTDWRDLKVLPWGGDDLMEQPAIVLDAIRECNRVWNQVLAERAKEASRGA
jgi:hypothetical protein